MAAMKLCVICGIATDRCNTIGRRSLQDETILSIVRVAHQAVTKNDFICQACWNNISSATLEGNRPEESLIGHRQVCILCGCSVLRRTRYHQLSTNSVQQRKVGASSIVCHSCWMRADRASRHFYSGPSTSTASSSTNQSESLEVLNNEIQQEPLTRSHTAQRVLPTATPTIVLPNYLRAVETESRCFVEGCHRRERNRVTVSIRKQLLKTYNYYVSPNNRLCDFHLTCTSWDFLNGINNNTINTFTANHIQDMFSLKESGLGTSNPSLLLVSNSSSPSLSLNLMTHFHSAFCYMSLNILRRLSLVLW